MKSDLQQQPAQGLSCCILQLCPLPLSLPLLQQLQAELAAVLGGGGGQFHCRKGLQQEPECGSHGGGLDPPEPWTPEMKLNELVHTKGLQMNRFKDAEQESKMGSEQDKVGYGTESSPQG